MAIVSMRVGVGVVTMAEDGKHTYFVRDRDFPDWDHVARKTNPRIGDLILSRTVQLNAVSCGGVERDDEKYEPCRLLYPV
ncbi:unnamed protein product, partial [marine sediment metagenome]